MAGGLDFGILQPINPTGGAKVVGHGSSSTSSNKQNSGSPAQTISSLAGGISQGLNAGANRRGIDAQTAETKQRTAQEAAKFPDELRNSHNQADLNQLIVDRAKQDDTDQKALRAAALKGPDQFANMLQQMGSQNPQVASQFKDYQFKTAKIDSDIKALAVTDSKNANEAAVNKLNMLNMISGVTRMAASGTTPEQKQQFYDYGRSQLPKSIQSIMPPQYDNNTAMAFSRQAHEAQMADIAQKVEASGGSNLIKNQTIRAYTQQQIDQKIQAGANPNDPTVQQLSQQRDELNKAIMNDPTMTGKTGKQADPKADAQKTINDTDNKEMLARENEQPALQTFASDVHSVEGILDRVPKGFVGKIQDLTKANINYSDIQILQHHFSSMGYLAKSVMANQTAGMRLTNTELNQLNNIVGGTSVNWDTNKAIMGDMKNKLLTKTYDDWQLSDRVRAQGNPDAYTNWRKDNPEPINPNKSGVSDYLHAGQPVPYDALNKARWDNPGLSEDQVATKFGLQRSNQPASAQPSAAQAPQPAVQQSSMPQQPQTPQQAQPQPMPQQAVQPMQSTMQQAPQPQQLPQQQPMPQPGANQ